MTGERPRIDIQSILRLTELADYVIPFAIRVVCSLRVADLLIGDGLFGLPQVLDASAHVESSLDVPRPPGLPAGAYPPPASGTCGAVRY